MTGVASYGWTLHTRLTPHVTAALAHTVLATRAGCTAHVVHGRPPLALATKRALRRALLGARVTLSLLLPLTQLAGDDVCSLGDVGVVFRWLSLRLQQVYAHVS